MLRVSSETSFQCCESSLRLLFGESILTSFNYCSFLITNSNRFLQPCRIRIYRRMSTGERFKSFQTIPSICDLRFCSMTLNKLIIMLTHNICFCLFIRQSCLSYSLGLFEQITPQARRRRWEPVLAKVLELWEVKRLTTT